jgi:hypothetical protein
LSAAGLRDDPAKACSSRLQQRLRVLASSPIEAQVSVAELEVRELARQLRFNRSMPKAETPSVAARVLVVIQDLVAQLVGDLLVASSELLGELTGRSPAPLVAQLLEPSANFLRACRRWRATTTRGACAGSS